MFPVLSRGYLTDPVLQVGLMIAYVYIVCLGAFFLLRLATAFIIDLIGASNFLWLRSVIARERGIAAYRAWLPLERIRPRDIRRTSGKRPLRGPRATCRRILPCFTGLRALWWFTP